MQKICIVVPCYNEAGRLDADAFLRFTLSHPECFILFVNDGSKDKTLALLNQTAGKNPEQIHVLDCEQNGGKAEAVRLGMLASLEWQTFSFCGYFDADLATPLEEGLRLAQALNAHPSAAFSFGSRVRRLGSTIERSGLRHFLGRGFATLASLSLGLPVYDTQCGAKMLRSEFIPEVFRERFLTRWLFDVEIFFRFIHLLGKEALHTRALEIPLNTWIEKGDSRVKFSDMLKVPFALLRIRKHYLGK